jgi:UDP-N-acetylglucosamine--N-acetylmuramyl-(pentapeptide) pyrophosphoryl-undecaprenol N-acetylglucosamine transferase
MPAMQVSGRSIDVGPLHAIFSGGGTGGHLFPALAIADEVRRLEPGAQVLFVGTSDKIEARVVPAKGYAFRSIWISGFRRGFYASNLLFPIRTVVGLMQAISIIKRFKPDVVVGTGGYVSGPVLRAAVMLKIPTLIQEQNSYPGVTTRLLAGKVDEVHLTFERSRKYITRTENVYITGNPTRSDLDNVDLDDACRYFGFEPADRNKTILVVGGSLGARSLNLAIGNHLELLIRHGLRVIWQTGADEFEKTKQLCAQYPAGRIWVGAFIDRMEYAYRVSDLVVCRAGATTIAELTRLGKPAILVPYPHAAANHQVENARSLAGSGAAEVVFDHESLAVLGERIVAALDDTRLNEMSVHSKKLGKPEAAVRIAERIIELARRSRSAPDAALQKG